MGPTIVLLGRLDGLEVHLAAVVHQLRKPLQDNRLQRQVRVVYGAQYRVVHQLQRPLQVRGGLQRVLLLLRGANQLLPQR